MEINFGAEEALRAAVGYDTIPYWVIKGFVVWLIALAFVCLIPEQYVRVVMPKKAAYLMATFLTVLIVILAVNDTDPFAFAITFCSVFMSNIKAGCRNCGTDGFSIEFMWWMIICLIAITIVDFALKRVHPKSAALTEVIDKAPVWALLIGGFCIWNDISVITLVTSFVTAFVTGLNF